MSTTSLYRRVAASVRASIAAGALPAGCKLASVRQLAREHGVSVMTALEALRLLEQEGWAVARPRSGFYAAKRPLPVPLAPLPSTPLDDQTRVHLAIMEAPCRVPLDLIRGDPTLYPVEKLGILMRRAIYREPSLLGSHVHGTGYAVLKEQIARRAVEYGCRLNPAELVITHGCVESMALALRTVVRAGDGVAIESPAYFVLLQMLRGLGLRAVEIPMLSQGLDLDALESALRHRRAKAVLCVANVNNPTGITMPFERKKALVDLVERHGAALIENDIYGDTYFGDRRPRPLRTLSDRVILCSSFSKTLAPGIRVGWIAAGRWSAAIASGEYASTVGTAIYPQAAIAEFLRSGGYGLHMRRLRHALKQRVGSMRQAVVDAFPAGTRVSDPSGGYVLWVELPSHDLQTDRLFELAHAEGIGIVPGHLFSTDGRFGHCFRLNAGFAWSPETQHAIKRLAELARSPEQA